MKKDKSVRRTVRHQKMFMYPHGGEVRAETHQEGQGCTGEVTNNVEAKQKGRYENDSYVQANCKPPEEKQTAN